MKRRGLLTLGVLVTIHLIAGCAISTPAIGSKSLENTTQNQPQRDVSLFVGRLSLVIDPAAGSNAQPQSFSGGFELRGDARNGELDLLTPLGTIVMQLRWQPGMALILRGNERQQFGSSQELLQLATGASLTLDDLFAWLQGKNAAAHSTAPAQAPNTAWQVDLSAHQSGRIVARRMLPTPAVLRIALEQP